MAVIGSAWQEVWADNVWSDTWVGFGGEDVATLDFTVVVLPDTQNYFSTSTKRNQLINQITWVTDNYGDHPADEFKLLHVGDITNQNLDTEWDDAVTIINDALVAESMPYLMVTGNHDMDSADLPRSSSSYNAKWNTEHSAQPTTTGMVLKTAGEYENWYLLTTMNGPRNVCWMGLEWKPEDATLDWASGICNGAAANYDVFLVTHENLWEGSTGLDEYGFAIPERQSASLNLWSKFLNQHQNVQIAWSGHAVFIGGDEDLDQDEYGWMASARLSTQNSKGRIVHEITHNSQDNKYLVAASGGGWFRKYEFYSDSSVVCTTVNSQDGTVLTSRNNSFTFYIDEIGGDPVNLNSGLLFHAKFDEASGTIRDSTGTSTITPDSAGTLTQGEPTLVPLNASGKSVKIEGDERLALSPAASVDAEGSFSVSCFIKPTTFAHSMYVTDSAGIDRFGFGHGADDNIRLTIASTVIDQSMAADFVVNDVYHIAVTRSGFTGEVIFYKTDITNSGATEAITSGDIADETKDWDLEYIGGRNDDQSNDLDSWLDDLRFYNRVLNPTEIARLAAGPYSSRAQVSPGVSSDPQLAVSFSPTHSQY